MYSDNVFFTLQPIYLFELGFSKAETAAIVSIGAAADMSSRVFLAVICFCFAVTARTIFLAGVIGAIFARFGINPTYKITMLNQIVIPFSFFLVFLLLNDFIGMAIITAILGFLRAWLHVTLSLVFGEYLPQKRFASGYALFM